MPAVSMIQRLLSCTLFLVHLGAWVQAQVVTDTVHEMPIGVEILFKGPELQSFDRPLPDVVEKSLFREFESYFNETQDFQASGSNKYQALGRQVVVSIKNGRVTGVMGDVYDAQGRMFTEFSTSANLPDILDQSQRNCKHFPRLATVIQKYGAMYYHFIQEVLPRFVLLSKHLDQDTKILSFGSAHEFKWLAELGITREQIEIYDPTVVYCADELIVPSASPVITPPKENYELVQSAFNIGSEAPEDRNLVIYCSRSDASDRVIANEAAILSAIRQHFPSVKLYVYTGEESASETVKLFRRARVVLGMHGAGLSHTIFSSPGTSVVEFLFMSDPPMMFWHASAALKQHYVMVPLARSWWLEKHVNVPVQDVVDALFLTQGDVKEDCKPGFFHFLVSGECMACPAGTYRPVGASSCLPCAGGRVAESEGSAFCSTCPAGTFSDAGFDCVSCADDETTLFPGSPSKEQCLTYDNADAKLDGMFNSDVLVEKLVSLPALQLPKPKNSWEWIKAVLSPKRWMKLWRQRQLQHQYLGELFNSDMHLRDITPSATEGRMLQEVNVGYRRSMLYGDSRRSMLYGDSRRSMLYGDSRRSMLYGDSRRSMLYGDSRRSMLYGPIARRSLLYGGETRRSLIYSDLRRSMLYGERRRTQAYGRRMAEYMLSPARRLGSLARKLTQSFSALTRPSILPGSRMMHGNEISIWQMWMSFWSWVWRMLAM